jgi:NADH dehydrogenase
VKLASATALEAILSDGRRLPARTIISCTGTAQSPVLTELPFERDRGGRLVADEFGCVDADAQVWSGGDCGAIPLKTGGTAPALAIYAIEAGKTIGTNIARTIRGKKLKRYSFTGFGDCCALGYGKAVGQVWGVPLWGLPAWITWRVCMIVYLPSWLKRVRTMLDWMTTPFFGRDIISVGSPDEVGVQPELFEDGQVVVRQGDVGRAMFIVRSGTVTVVRELADGKSEHLADLGPGDHFGEIAVLRDVRRTATVRAVGPVELLRVSRAGTRMLASSFEAFNQVSSTAQTRHEATGP